MRYRVIQVPMDEALLKDVDSASRTRHQSRAALIREACEKYLADLHEQELERQYVEGYERMPEGEDEEAWARIGHEKLAELLGGDNW